MTALQVSAQKQLRQLVEQIERLEEEKKALAGDIRDKYLEAKAVGFDAKALRKIVSLRKKSQTDRQEEEAILAVYMHALGMIDEAPEQPAARGDGRGGVGLGIPFPTPMSANLCWSAGPLMAAAPRFVDGRKETDGCKACEKWRTALEAAGVVSIDADVNCRTGCGSKEIA